MIKKLLLCLALFGWIDSACAALNVVSCEPEWGALTAELGGDKVSVYNATNALQDVHHIQARPSLLARARSADLIVCSGAELEVGWLPILLRQSANSRIQPDQPGYFEASNYVRKLDIPDRIDRAEGDVHPSGNPHIQTDPRNIGLVAAKLADRLAQIDPANSAYYRSRYQNFDSRWNAAIVRWEKQAAPLNGVKIVVHHKGWSYLEHWLGLVEVGELEPKPGVEPTAAHLENLLAQLQHNPAKMVIRAAYNDSHASDWLSQRAHIPAVTLPFTVGGDAAAGDLFGLFDDTIKLLTQAAK